MIVIWFLVGINAVLCTDTSEKTGNEPKAVTLQDFTPEKGYEPKNSGWTKIATKNELSINVAEFNKASNNECVRVVHFSVEQEPLDAVEVPCDDSPLHTGLVLRDGAYLMYYTVAYVERVSKSSKSTWEKYDSVRLTDISTCNYVSIVREPSGIHSRKMMRVQREENSWCKKLVDENIAPMSLLSYSDVRSIDISKLEPIVSYNYGKNLGARIYQIKNGLVCYRQLRFYSFDLDLDLALTMTCGPVRGISMKEQAFQSRDVMIQPHVTEKETLTLFINPSSLFEQSKEGFESPKCIKKTFTLTKDGDRYVKNMKDKEFVQESPECNKFVEGNLAGKRGSDGETPIQSFYPFIKIEQLLVDDVQAFMSKYRLVQRNDYNLENELGIVVLKFKRPDAPGFKNVIYVIVRCTIHEIVRGVVLTWYILEDNPDRVVLGISGDKLYYNEVLVVKKSLDDSFTVIMQKNNACVKKTYRIYVPGVSETVEDWWTVSKTDPHCKDLLTRKQGNVQQSQTP